ncbi:unnamed protein product [Phytophthora fragariaefolia]|uniref:Unnamed protein product n=1 Tax=Phytophthora fragariaefolia TaxID=1490495 RepID=A0A9W7CWC1_9STRA|nr:unnamed protein product [Phytophthora fragariaefolia]
MLDAVKMFMRMLKDAGNVLGSFDANELFSMVQSATRETTLNLFARLIPIVGIVVPVPQEASTPTRSQARSSQYASATSEAGSGSHSSAKLQRMTLGPSGSDPERKRQRHTRRRVQSYPTRHHRACSHSSTQPWNEQSDESPLEYLYRLIVAGLRVQFSITDGSTEARREHVDHFIEKLDDRDLTSKMALLRIPDADTIEETLRSQERETARQGKTVFGSIRPKPKAPVGAAHPPTPVPSGQSMPGPALANQIQRPVDRKVKAT